MSAPAGTSRWRGLGWVAGTFLVSRGLILLTALAVMTSTRHSFTTVVSRWDVQHFIRIANQGYLDHVEMAFFPGLPLLLRLGAGLGLPTVLSGLLIALVGSALAALALHRLAGPLAACLWLIAPTAVFTVVSYTEAPFCAAAFWAFERARAGRWWPAAVLAMLACTLRISGLFLIGALGVMAISQAVEHREGLRGLLRRALWLLAPTAVLAGYLAYLHHLTGSWTAWFDAQQQGWPRGFHTPWQALLNTLAAVDPARWPGRPEVPWVFAAELVAMAVGLLTTCWCAWRRRWAEAAWVGIQVVAFATSFWFMSVNRAVLLWFPTFAMLAGWLAWRPGHPGRARAWQLLGGLAVAGSVVLMTIWAWLFFRGAWAS